MSPLISVLMPCYNASATLVEALDSLQAQTLADFEIVAVDDGSTDATAAMMVAWVQKEPRLRVVNMAEHEGITAALNAGLRHCRATWVARMDADDRCLPARLERQIAYAAEHPGCSVVGCQVRAFPEGQVGEGLRLYLEWQNSLLSHEQMRREMFVESPLVHPSVMFRREVVGQAGGYQDLGWPEDYDLWLRLFQAGVKFCKTPGVLLEWREDPGRLTRTDERYSMENFLRLKAQYLCTGPLAGSDGVIVWGAGEMGRRLGRHLRRLGAPLVAFADVDPRKIGSVRLGLPVIGPQALNDWRSRFSHPVVLAAVGTRGARPIVRARLDRLGLVETEDWWFAA